MIDIKVQSVGEQYVDDLGQLSPRASTGHAIELSVFVQNGYLSADQIVSDLVTKLHYTHKIYFVYSEFIPSRVSRLKSYKKLFYQERRAGLVRASELFEVEIPTGERESILAALISPKSSESVNNILARLLDGRLRMLLFVPKGKRSFRSNRANFLKTIVSDLKLDGGRTLFLDTNKIANLLITKHQCVVYPNPYRGADKKVDIILNEVGYRPIRMLLDQYRQSVLN